MPEDLENIVNNVKRAYAPLHHQIGALVLRGKHLLSAIADLENERRDTAEEFQERLIWVVNTFDQANTNRGIQGLKGGPELKQKVNVLRNYLNRDGKKTLLSEKEAEPAPMR